MDEELTPHKAAFLLLPLLGARGRLNDTEREALVVLTRHPGGCRV